MPLTPNDLRELLRSRRTIHDFQSTVPPWTEVRDALESARFAPNHYFTQPWRFYRLGPHTQSALIALNTALVEARKGPDAAAAKQARWSAVPGWLVITCTRSSNALTAKEDYAATCCAVQNLMLDLWSHGIGCKWTTGEVIRQEAFFRLLGIKRHQEDVVGLLWYGYPARVPKAVRSPLDTRIKLLP